MQRRSTTTGFMLDDYCMIQDTVGVLSDTERGLDMLAS